jgi:protein TonB
MIKAIRSIQREFLFSLLIHIVVLGAAIVFGSQLDKRTEPVVVFLSEEMPGGNKGTGTKEIGFQLKKGKPSHAGKRTEAANRTTTEKAISIEKKKTDSAESPTTSSDMTAMNNASSASIVSEGIPTGAVSVGGGSGGPGGGGFGFGSGGQGGSGGGTGRGHGTGSGDANVLAEQYLAEHYAYIRNLIMKHLKYPHMAKKMGWKGKVVVSFLIKESGRIENAKIIAGSGYDVLDKNVLSVIKEVQPFPRPPVKAELVIPITYKLE